MNASKIEPPAVVVGERRAVVLPGAGFKPASDAGLGAKAFRGDPRASIELGYPGTTSVRQPTSARAASSNSGLVIATCFGVNFPLAHTIPVTFSPGPISVASIWSS